MQLGGIVGFLYKISEWIVRLAYLNLLWIMFILSGLVIFGIMPATAAMFSIVRKWLMGDTDISLFKTFWSYYKADFIKMNILGIILFIFSVSIYVNIEFIQTSTNSFLNVLYVPILLITFFYCLILLYIIPVYVHYDFKLIQVIKNAFIIMIFNPLSTLLMVIGSFLIYLIISFVPGLFLFFSGSSVALVIMLSANLAFKNIERKREKMVEAKAD